MSVALKSGLSKISYDPADGQKLDLLHWKSTKEACGENFLELLFVFCAICHVFHKVVLRGYCVSCWIVCALHPSVVPHFAVC